MLECPHCETPIIKPKFEHDDGTYYVKCPACTLRVKLRQLPTPDGAPLQFEVSEAQ